VNVINVAQNIKQSVHFVSNYPFFLNFNIHLKRQHIGVPV